VSLRGNRRHGRLQSYGLPVVSQISRRQLLGGEFRVAAVSASSTNPASVDDLVPTTSSTTTTTIPPTPPPTRSPLLLAGAALAALATLLAAWRARRMTDG